MAGRLDDRWMSAPNDGAFAPIGVVPSPSGSDYEELLRAWHQERQENIELGLYLEQAERLLSRIQADKGLSREGLRRAKFLTLAIRAAVRERRHNSG